MKILDAIQVVPSKGAQGSKYDHVYRAVESARGAWVPVECDDQVEAVRIYNAFRQSKLRRDLEIKRRKSTIYVRLAMAVAPSLTLAR